MLTPYEKENTKIVYSTEEEHIEEHDYSMLGLVKNEDGFWQIDESLIYHGEE